ncbi:MULTISPECIES: restriction endonuclease subunit S [Lactococcus]|uniref:restriction endonuclease subunit S n=1 Tax=Lactococcus TaxID=1357 RepID=UPI0024C491E6|nr:MULTISPECIES: restriction endonuclease subunit S [Lactococcus]MDT2852731.1 restriction endonuclease subunit S [Lactococcus lactis]WKY25480.1 restriction endonuclease subunit S [Lactococcus sp. bn62]
MAKIDDSVKKKVPELRFKGFTDEWEERKFDECFNFPVSTNSLSRALLNYDEGDIKSVHYGDILIKYPAILNIKNDKIPYITGGKLEKYKSSLLENGDLIFADAAEDETVGKAVEVNGLTEENLVAGLHTIVARPKDKKAEFFLGYYINSNTYHRQLLRLIQGSKVSSISKGNLQKTLVSFPKDFEEQQKIGSFFKQLDITIALHQRKLDLLKEQKKGYLQKMFPKAGEKIPELRFAGFADDWEDRKLSSIAERVTRKNKNNESTLPLTISAQDGLVDQNDYFNKQVASRDVTGYFLVKNGEFAYNKSYSNGYPWGAIKRLDKYEMGVLSTLYIVFKPTAINSQFLVSYYETTRWYREVSKNAAEGARNHGLLNISPNDFFNTLLTIPKSAEEQQQIGSFFKQLDDTIALHQRKLDLLKEQKKGFLQKMFI